jgi:hypothetical protein
MVHRLDETGPPIGNALDVIADADTEWVAIPVARLDPAFRGRQVWFVGDDDELARRLA